jgi:hypothetical protein
MSVTPGCSVVGDRLVVLRVKDKSSEVLLGGLDLLTATDAFEGHV